MQARECRLALSFLRAKKKGGFMETIIVAVLGVIGTIVGSYFSNRKNSILIAYRLEQLENKVNQHNQVIERTYKLEEATALQEKDLRVLNHRISDLEAAEKE